MHLAALLGTTAFLAGFSLRAEAPLLTVLAQELERNFRILKEKAEPRPYFLAYAVTEEETGSVSAMLGALKSSGREHHRLLDITIRVGSPRLDNYHRLPAERVQFTQHVFLPLDDIPAAIQRRVWLETDRTYRLAAERLIKIRTNQQIKVAESDDSADFSREEPSVFSEAPPRLEFDLEGWAARVRHWSAELAKPPVVITSGVSVFAQRETKYFVSTEGARLEHGRGFARVMINARGKADDGMDLSTHENFEAIDTHGLPGDAELRAAVEHVAKDLAGLLRAPIVEPFVGPAILSGRAAGVFFHEIFGHRIEGHRQKDEREGQTFTKSVGTKVLPEFLSVVFDPTRRRFRDIDLNGWYRYDDEGLQSRRVLVVEQGVLKTFLMSRSPIEGFPHSNGHGRRSPGAEVVSRQSNLFVESAQKVPEARLREMLVQEIRRQSKPYGLYFKEVTGGFTSTERRGVQAFKVLPLVVYRVYPGGRPDELVRGADIVGTPLASFAKILATSDREEVFNGYCGAESGTVPVSAIAPALLVSEIEIEKKEKSEDRPPILPAPFTTGAGS